MAGSHSRTVPSPPEASSVRRSGSGTAATALTVSVWPSTGGCSVSRRRGRVGGRPAAIVGEKLSAIIAALNSGMSKAAVCRNFGVKRTTLIETLARLGEPDLTGITDVAA